ncbi:MAG: hypothetical protein ABIQ10_06070 [Gemmatimonadaceae bacterium]
MASIRQWYPEIPIFLLKDDVSGPFCTREIEDVWNVQLWPTAERSFGWGFIKLEPLFGAERIRYLILDSDIVFLGRVIDALEKFDTDFVVQQELQPERDVAPLYFDSARIRASINPVFPGPSFTFNSGQYVATAGLVSREDFGDLVVWSEPRRVRYPDMFNAGDQGVLNYVVNQRAAAGAITVARTPFMKWSREEMSEFAVAMLGEASPYPFVIHWAGLKKARLGQMLRADILRHFEGAYYAKVSNGFTRRRSRILRTEIERWYSRGGRVAGKIVRRLRSIPGSV